LKYADIEALLCEGRRAALKRAFEMHECTYRFFALGSDCVLRLFAGQKAVAHEAAAAASNEIARIEARYSRYRSDSELSRINAVGKVGGSVDVDAETAGLIDYAYASYQKSDGLFDITSGLLRGAWDFSSGNLPSRDAIAELLPRIGLDKVGWSAPRLTFEIAGMELDLGGIGKEYAVDRGAGYVRRWAFNTVSSILVEISARSAHFLTALHGRSAFVILGTPLSQWQRLI
jgi:thiamine biosynthesis lipoprotein